jgi:hypothetical protein
MTVGTVRGIRFSATAWSEVLREADRLEMSPGELVRESVDFYLSKFVRFMEPAGPRELVQ